MRGWYYEGYRHSLAARGISSSLLKKNSMAYAPRGKEIHRTFRPMSKREYLFDDIKFLEEVVEHPPEDLPQETLKELALELEKKQDEFSSLTTPRRIIHTGEMYERKPWEERYKGIKGRKPELIQDLRIHLDLLKSPQEKQKDYKRHLEELSDERAAKVALERIEANILREPELAEEELIGPEVIVEVRPGAKSIEKPEQFPELNYVLKKDFPGQSPRETKDFLRYRQQDPKKYDEFRTKVLKSGAELVFGRNKKTKKWELQSIMVKKK